VRNASEMCWAFGAGTGAHFAMSAAAYYTKWVIVVDEDVDPTDLSDVLWALSSSARSCRPSALVGQNELITLG
jgi:UbiD family decarboxylase